MRRSGPSVVCAAAAWACVAAAAEAGTVNRIVAVVDDEVITEADVTFHLTSLLEDQTQVVPADADAVALQQVVLRRLIEQRLILQEARRAGITVPSDEVRDRLEALRAKYGSDEEFKASLAESRLSEEQLKEKIREQLLVQKIVDQDVRAAILVSPQEIAEELAKRPGAAPTGERVRARHLLIRVNGERPEARARALADQVYQQLKRGEPFEALARRYSEDQHAQDGGDMGWVAQGELLQELDEALFHLQPGEVSAPIKTALGFHVLTVEERRRAESLPPADANRTIYQQLYERKFREAFQRWLGELRRRAYIEILVSEG